MASCTNLVQKNQNQFRELNRHILTFYEINFTIWSHILSSGGWCCKCCKVWWSSRPVNNLTRVLLLNWVWVTPPPFLFFGKISPEKWDFKNEEFENEVVLEGFWKATSQLNKIKWIIRLFFLIFNLKCVAKNVQAWLRMCTSYLVYGQPYLAKSSYGWLQLLLYYLPMDDHHFGWIDGAWTRHFFIGFSLPARPMQSWGNAFSFNLVTLLKWQ